jgi:hypothetical protein
VVFLTALGLRKHLIFMEISKLFVFLLKPVRRRLSGGGRGAIFAPACRQLAACLALLLAANFATAAAGMGEPAPALPAWQTLEFEQSVYWVTARSRVTINPKPDDPRNWLLTATSSVASNAEEVQIELEANSGRALHRSRLSRGKQQRYKSYQFLPDHILRERREPGDNPAREPAQWPLSSSRNTPYPAAAEGLVVTDAYALLYLAGRFVHSPQEHTEVVVNTDANFYRVRMTHGKDSAVEVDYQITGQHSPVTGERESSEVILSIRAVGAAPDKPDFSLLGLNGEITLQLDRVSGLPLLLRGTAPRVGATEIKLRAVTLSEPAT